jgi:hypothetical protein
MLAPPIDAEIRGAGITVIAINWRIDTDAIAANIIRTVIAIIAIRAAHATCSAVQAKSVVARINRTGIAIVTADRSVDASSASITTIIGAKIVVIAVNHSEGACGIVARICRARVSVIADDTEYIYNKCVGASSRVFRDNNQVHIATNR